MFGLVWQKPTHCKKHKLDNYVDVQSHRCKYSNCTKRPLYALPGQKPTHCAKHKLENQIDVKRRLCTTKNCDKTAKYNKPGYSPDFCREHKQECMILNPTKKLKDEVKECSFCNHVIHYNAEYCKGCKTYIALGNKTVKYHKKENEIKFLLDENKIAYTHDKIVVDGCSRKRPDFHIRTNNGKVIILEVDEFQHKRKNYSCECELSRMKQIFFDVGEENLLFIRYNPDSYISINGIEFTKRQRSEYLVKYLKQHLDNSSFGKLGVVYLFYDGFVLDQEIEQLDPYGAN